MDFRSLQKLFLTSPRTHKGVEVVCTTLTPSGMMVISSLPDLITVQISGINKHNSATVLHLFCRNSSLPQNSSYNLSRVRLDIPKGFSSNRFLILCLTSARTCMTGLP